MRLHVLLALAAALIVGCSHGASSVVTSSTNGRVVRPNITITHIPSTSTGADYFQAFDGNINYSNISTDAMTVGDMWGADPTGSNKAAAWLTDGSAVVGFYMPGFGDADSAAFGNYGQTKAWWEAQTSGATPKVDWLEYKCDEMTPAAFSGLNNPVLDISNTNVINYQADLVNTAATAGGTTNFNSVDFDLVNVINNTGACGHYKTVQVIPGVYSQVWVAQYCGGVQANCNQYETAYATDVKNWASAMQTRLHNQYTNPYMMQINMEVNKYSSPSSGCSPSACAASYYVMQHTDIEQNESGPVGGGPNSWLSAAEFQANLDWATEVQSTQGEDYLESAEFIGDTGPPSQQEREYAFGAYLLGKHGHNAMYWENHTNGPTENYWYNLSSPSEFSYSEGATCGSPSTYYISNNDAHLFYRIYHKAVTVVNADANNTYTVAVQTFSWDQAGNAGNDNQSYFDIESGNSPPPTVSLAPHAGKVWLSSSDLGCPAPPSPLP